jgi:transcription termination/antitermination protein NusG
MKDENNKNNPNNQEQQQQDSIASSGKKEEESLPPSTGLKEIPPDKEGMSWYVIQVATSYEDRAKKVLLDSINKNNMFEYFGEVIIPEEEIIEVVGGEKKRKKKKFFPGYILIQMKMEPKVWQFVNRCFYVGGFVGKSKPKPLSPQEVKNLFSRMIEGAEKPRVEIQFNEGDQVKVIDGPFINFAGMVEEVNKEKGKLTVLVSIFGRQTRVELSFSQVERVFA